MEMASYAICCAPVDTPIVCVSWRSLPKIGSMGPFRLLDEVELVCGSLQPFRSQLCLQARSAYAQWAAVSDDDLPVLPPPRTHHVSEAMMWWQVLKALVPLFLFA